MAKKKTQTKEVLKNDYQDNIQELDGMIANLDNNKQEILLEDMDTNLEIPDTGMEIKPIYKIKVKVKLNKENGAKLPSKKRESDTGFDLYATNKVTVFPLKKTIIPTSINLEIPEGYDATVKGRSGLAFDNGLIIFHGTIDSGYRGEIKVLVFNVGDHPIVISEGQRFAQLVFNKKLDIELEEVEELSDSDRGEEGFGASGKE
jgi:dUTP pyrophosphatase